MQIIEHIIEQMIGQCDEIGNLKDVLEGNGLLEAVVSIKPRHAYELQ